jgi:uncharacterized protein
MATGRQLHPPTLHVDLPEAAIAQFCERWHVAEFAVFGSILREDFHTNSDINVLLTFDVGIRHGMFDLAQMEAELKDVFHREVMVLTRRGVELSSNPVRRKQILESAEVVYARR